MVSSTVALRFVKVVEAWNFLNSR